jgi:hypothetical protein
MSKSDVIEWQETLRQMGFDIVADGDFGPASLEASIQSLGNNAPPPPPVPDTEIPTNWLPASTKMSKVIAHWTAGSYTVSETDREHYHFIWGGDAVVVRGDNPVTANESTSDGVYAAHTKNCNTGSIGVSLACMAGATESPFNSGSYPMRRSQWDAMCRGIAQLCAFYKIKVTPTTVLSHGEVQANLGIAQDGKWDYTRLSWAPEVQGAKACGDLMREQVSMLMT